MTYTILLLLTVVTMYSYINTVDYVTGRTSGML